MAIQCPLNLIEILFACVSFALDRPAGRSFIFTGFSDASVAVTRSQPRTTFFPSDDTIQRYSSQRYYVQIWVRFRIQSWRMPKYDR